jgi:hypothetical protein
VLAIRPGRIERVGYNLTVWRPAVRRLAFDGGLIRLEGFRSQHANTVTVAGLGRQRLTLLVVPPDATPASAHDVLMLASQRGNRESSEALLASSHVTPVVAENNTGTEFMEPETQR